jgi:hypothetical protein
MSNEHPAWVNVPAVRDVGEAVVSAMGLAGIDYIFFTSGSEICFYQEAIAKIKSEGRAAQGVVEEFVDQRFVHFDLAKARVYTVSLALAKVNEEIRLTAGQKIDASTQKPRINYKLLEKRAGDRRASFLYEGTITSDDGTSFTRKWLITARKEGNDWRVSNFTESD